MSTIQELTDEQMDWEMFKDKLKIRKRNWEDCYYFIPYFLDAEGNWIGADEQNRSDYFNSAEDDWELYVDKPKKLKHWMWVNRSTGYTSKRMYTEGYMQKEFNLVVWVKIPGTEIELEV